MSGDNLSVRSESVSPVTQAPPPPADQTATDENLDDISNLDPDDTSSIFSDDSDDFQTPNNYRLNNNNANNNINNRGHRRGIRELNNLGNVEHLPRLRSGRPGRR